MRHYRRGGEVVGDRRCRSADASTARAMRTQTIAVSGQRASAKSAVMAALSMPEDGVDRCAIKIRPSTRPCEFRTCGPQNPSRCHCPARASVSLRFQHNRQEPSMVFRGSGLGLAGAVMMARGFTARQPCSERASEPTVAAAYSEACAPAEHALPGQWSIMATNLG